MENYETETSRTKRPREDVGGFEDHQSDRTGGAPNPLNGKPLSSKYCKLLNLRLKLPINQHSDAILDAVRKNMITLLVGETGSGKTTQVPQLLLWQSDLMGRVPGTATPSTSKIRVAITQPRRLAAVQVATRVAEELDVNLGEEVGYSVRFDEKCSPGLTRLTFLTEGMLLQQMLSDRYLQRYDLIIIDEAHERSADCDLLLGLLKVVLPMRNKLTSADGVRGVFGDSGVTHTTDNSLLLHTPLKLMVMSATLDVDSFAHFFESVNKEYYDSQPGKDGWPLQQETKRTVPDDGWGEGAAQSEGISNYPNVVHVPGRLHRVSEEYATTRIVNVEDQAVAKALALHQETQVSSGDVLIFLSSEKDVERAVAKCKRALQGKENVKVFRLFGQLPLEEQQKIFEPVDDGIRRLIFSTNIAETSLTIDGVGYVIDSGFQKQKMFYQQARVDCLVQTPISKASARQRAGRAGRTKNGVCFRLYTKNDFAGMPDSAHPEFKRTKLTEIVLMMLKLSVQNIMAFNYLSPPSADAIFQALQELMYLGVINEDGFLTPLGEHVSQLPVDASIGRMLFRSARHGSTREIIQLAAMLCCGGRVWVDDSSGRNDSLRTNSLHGDHVALIELLDNFMEFGQSLDWCMNHFVYFKDLAQAVKIAQQLHRILQKAGIRSMSSASTIVPSPAQESGTRRVYDFEKIKKAILEGLFLNTGFFVGFAPAPHIQTLLRQNNGDQSAVVKTLGGADPKGRLPQYLHVKYNQLLSQGEPKGFLGKLALPWPPTTPNNLQAKRGLNFLRNNVSKENPANAVEDHLLINSLQSVPQFVVYQELVLWVSHNNSLTNGEQSMSTKLRCVTPVEGQWLQETCSEYFDPLVAEEECNLLGHSVMRDKRLHQVLSSAKA